MTYGRDAMMASFMSKKKKYKFQVDVCLEELLEVPFVSAVLFAKMRLLDGGNFQDHSTREEVKDHQVKWCAKFTFPCKMCANASTGVLERCVLRISIRKECKGGRSFTKLGFVDLNLAEFAGAGVTYKKALLEGYDTRHRQDNSLLKFSINMNMLSGDVLFKVPSPSLKHKPVTTEELVVDNRTDEYSSGSVGGSTASGSSGFGSLPKKRPALLASELVIGQTLSENNVPASLSTDMEVLQVNSEHEISGEPGHSRNSSNTSQLSKASGYSSIPSHSHSRQSSSGDSGHIRNLHQSLRKTQFSKLFLQSPKFTRTNTYPAQFNLLNQTPPLENNRHSTPVKIGVNGSMLDASVYSTPMGYNTQTSNISSSSNEEYKTPESHILPKTDVFSQNFDLQKSASYGAVQLSQNLNFSRTRSTRIGNGIKFPRSNDLDFVNNNMALNGYHSKSDFEINPEPKVDIWFSSKFPNSLISFLTPSPKRKQLDFPSGNNHNHFKNPGAPPLLRQHSRKAQEGRTISLNSLRLSEDGAQRKSANSDNRNPSSSSLVLSETGSLDRAKAAYERRKKIPSQDTDNAVTAQSGRVENTRVNPDHLIEDLLKNTDLEPADDSAETSGLQLFIAKDGTAALGNHEVKSQMSTGVQIFKQVVMEDNR